MIRDLNKIKMRSIVIVSALLFAATAAAAQQVVASAGNSGTATGYAVDWTLGEPVIETISGSGNILTQGFHQTRLLITDISEMEFPGLEIKVYPNPAGRFLKIEIVQTGNEQFLYELSDIKGRIRVVREVNTNAAEIDLGSYVPGLYLLRVINSRQEFVKVVKVIKQ